ncbi:spore germination protein GerPE [Cohnella nanjingensis]|uniref:Spore germination protein GerPE n=1 Tax=Cohnella nanjingensis TaxID=1387779 RepID=A0A7X0RTQ3_9BACL|nr:spore germination protein GerPE [Cohnella nanjingensis]MBB6673400.1 spore germination protein GerPE [Cohnella nanjingensis]
MSLTCRESRVRNVYFNTVSQASVLQFGDDNGTTDLFNRVIAIQRAIADFESNELPFSAYSLYYRPILLPAPQEEVSFSSTAWGDIEIGDVQVIGLSNSALTRFGCSGPLTAETRIVNIRHFNASTISPATPVAPVPPVPPVSA